MSGMITSTHNSKVQLVRALLGRVKERQKQSAFVAEGVRLVEEALASAWTFRFVLHAPGLNPRARGLVRDLAAAGVELVPVTAEVMQSLSETEAPQGILAVLEHQPLPIPAPLSFIVILDSIRGIWEACCGPPRRRVCRPPSCPQERPMRSPRRWSEPGWERTSACRSGHWTGTGSACT